MKLHNQILNLPCPYAVQLAAEHDDAELAVYYRMGHKDALHAASDLVEPLEGLLRDVRAWLDIQHSSDEVQSLRKKIEKYIPL